MKICLKQLVFDSCHFSTRYISMNMDWRTIGTGLETIVTARNVVYRPEKITDNEEIVLGVKLMNILETFTFDWRSCFIVSAKGTGVR